MDTSAAASDEFKTLMANRGNVLMNISGEEAEAFLLQYGHGVGLSLWERPIFSKRFRGQNTPLREGMVFALETWKGAEDGTGAARIEEEVVVTKDGCEIITNFPSDRLISCGLPGCEVF